MSGAWLAPLLNPQPLLTLLSSSLTLRLSLHLNRVTMVALETAAELWMSLTDSSQTQWLEYSGLAGEMLLDEVRGGGG